LAQLYRLLPLAVLWVWPAVASRSRALSDLLQLDTLPAHRKFIQVVLPGIGPLLAAAFFIIFALAFAELPASNIVTPPGIDIFTIRLWGLMHTGLESHLAAVVLLALILITLTASLLWVFNVWISKKFENINHSMK
ncbi:MAG: hypothetical protein ACKO85_06150, partial [Isosphaeraceae bacterium]